jgi:hypothetical protein
MLGCDRLETIMRLVDIYLGTHASGEDMIAHCENQI